MVHIKKKKNLKKKKVKPRVTILPSNSIPTSIIKRNKNICPYKNLCTKFIAALFTIAKTWKQPKCPSAEEWIKKMWYIYTMEYYSAIK